MSLVQMLTEGERHFTTKLKELAQARHIPIETLSWVRPPEGGDLHTLIIGSNGKQSEHPVRTLDLTDPQREYLCTQHIESILDALARAVEGVG